MFFCQFFECFSLKNSLFFTFFFIKRRKKKEILVKIASEKLRKNDEKEHKFEFSETHFLKKIILIQKNRK
ncbi:hypothetical protein CGC52_06645 [Capnocytophaga sp. H2931]|nr:hypothetical protein CGC52_06645 [Capnocytophaga sp. H2931]